MTTSATRSPVPRDHPASPAARGADGGRHRTSLFTRLFGRQPIGILLAAPYAVFIAVIFAFPIGFAVYMSFTDYYFTAPGVTVPHPFVGLDNYKTVLTDPAVLASFGHIGIFLILNVPLTVALSLGLAVALNRAVHFRTFFRAAYYVPYVTASVAVVAVWLVLFRSDGLVNQILARWPRTPPGWSTPRGQCP